MIENERQYQITKAQAEKFAGALEQVVRHRERDSTVHPLLRKAEEDALRSQLEDLRAQLSEYEALRSGRGVGLRAESFEELPRALVQARVAAGLSQKELAEQLGLKEQQIQRYEATGYSSVRLARVMQIARALGVEVHAAVR